MLGWYKDKFVHCVVGRVFFVGALVEALRFHLKCIEMFLLSLNPKRGRKCFLVQISPLGKTRHVWRRGVVDLG